VTAFQPISEAARSWSDDNKLTVSIANYYSIKHCWKIIKVDFLFINRDSDKLHFSRGLIEKFSNPFIPHLSRSSKSLLPLLQCFGATVSRCALDKCNSWHFPGPGIEFLYNSKVRRGILRRILVTLYYNIRQVRLPPTVQY